jgi:hypothetical protein
MVGFSSNFAFIFATFDLGIHEIRLKSDTFVSFFCICEVVDSPTHHQLTFSEQHWQIVMLSFSFKEASFGLECII